MRAALQLTPMAPLLGRICLSCPVLPGTATDGSGQCSIPACRWLVARNRRPPNKHVHREFDSRTCSGECRNKPPRVARPQLVAGGLPETRTSGTAAGITIEAFNTPVRVTWTRHWFHGPPNLALSRHRLLIMRRECLAFLRGLGQAYARVKLDPSSLTQVHVLQRRILDSLPGIRGVVGPET